ncbi:MAG: sodium:solute symporter [Acidobacteriota bacterium]|nr:sodium:solute symporter [Acidobacteriota bacterium]
MHIADWIVILLYFAYVLAEGVRHGKKNKNLDDYFRGTRSLRWWAVGLSVMATQASAITYIGTTGQAYDSGMSFIQVYLPQPLVMVVLCMTFVPFFYKANIFTAYEYLERRFDAKTRSLTSFIFLLSRGLAVSFVLYAPSIILAVIFGWNEIVTILIMGASTILYTTVGGNKAVILIDAKQMLLMFAGIFVAIALFVSQFPSGFSLGDAVHLAGLEQKWNSIDLSLDPSNSYTLLSGMLGGFFLALSYFGCDQSQVQRYLTGRSLTESRMSLILNAFLKVPMQFLILAVGVLMFVSFHFIKPPLNFNESNHSTLVQKAGARYGELEKKHDAAFQERRLAAVSLSEARKSGRRELLSAAEQRYRRAETEFRNVKKENQVLLKSVLQAEPSSDINYIFPSFLIHHAPTGVLGIMLAVIFAAAMSSFSSEINSLASATIIDFYKRYFQMNASDSHYLWVSRGATLLWGCFATAAACYAGKLGSLIEAVNKVGSYFYGPILGVFLLAFLVRRSNGTGAFYGLLAGEAAVFAVAYYSSISWLYYNVVGVAAVLVAGTLISRIADSRR